MPSALNRGLQTGGCYFKWIRTTPWMPCGAISAQLYYWVEEHAAKAGKFENTWLIPTMPLKNKCLAVVLSLAVVLVVLSGQCLAVVLLAVVLRFLARRRSAAWLLFSARPSFSGSPPVPGRRSPFSPSV